MAVNPVLFIRFIHVAGSVGEDKLWALNKEKPTLVTGAIVNCLILLTYFPLMIFRRKCLWYYWPYHMFGTVLSSTIHRFIRRFVFISRRFIYQLERSTGHLSVSPLQLYFAHRNNFISNRNIMYSLMIEGSGVSDQFSRCTISALFSSNSHSKPTMLACNFHYHCHYSFLCHCPSILPLPLPLPLTALIGRQSIL